MKRFIFRFFWIACIAILPNTLIGWFRYQRGENITFAVNQFNSKLTYDEPQEPFKWFYVQTEYDMSKRKTNFMYRTSDYYGFKNYRPYADDPLIISGDSFFDDPHLDTHHGVQRIADSIFGKKVCYNIAHAGSGGIETYNECLERGIIHKPKMLVIECVQRFLYNWYDLKGSLQENKQKTRRSFFFGLDLALSGNLKDFNLELPEDQSVSIGHPEKIGDSTIYFLQDTTNIIPDGNLSQMIESMKFAVQYFANQGIKVCFVVVPDKESMYPSRFGASQIPVIQDRMKAANLSFVDAYAIVKQRPEFYYYAEDTHWNDNAIKAVLAEIKKVFVKP
jgi:hypothetical protein